jgi:hypothetical protein
MRFIKVFPLLILLFNYSYAGFDSLVVTLHGDTVIVNHVNAHTLCNVKFTFDVLIASDTITIVERDTSVGHSACRCGYHDLSVAIKGLRTPKIREGTYFIQTFRQELKKYNYLTDTTYLMCSTAFAYSDSGSSRVSYRSTQSECGGKTKYSDVVIFSNSFESSQDTVGWCGYIVFHPDAPSEGGRQSAYISGGCIWPHAWIELPPVETDGFFLLRCWGKDLEIGGSLSIETEDNNSKRAYIPVNNKTWTLYESAETLYCPSGKKILLSMGAGGIVPSAMLVDKIEIVKVDVVTSYRQDGEKMFFHTFELFQNYPNPFNPATVIRYQLPVNSYVTLKVYDILGRDVATLVNTAKEQGIYSATFDASKLPGGMYFYRLQFNNVTITKKMIVLK